MINIFLLPVFLIIFKYSVCLWREFSTRTRRIVILGSVHHTPLGDFLSTVRPTVHTNPSLKQRAFRKRFQTGRIWERRLFRFLVDWKHYENIAFQFENDGVTIPLTECCCSKHKSKMSGDPALRCVFRVNPPFSSPSGVVWTRQALTFYLKFRRICKPRSLCCGKND